MSLEVTTQKINHDTTGSQTDFTFPFKIIDETDLRVYFVDENDNSTTYALNVDYTVTGGTSEGTGEIQCTTAPADNGVLTILRAVPQTQTVALSSQGPMPAGTIQSMVEKCMMAIQDLQEQINRIDLSPPTAAEGSTAMTQAEGDLRYARLTGGTVSANLGCASAPSSGNHYMNQTYGAATYVAKSGGAVTGDITRAADPGSDNALCRKSYVTDFMDGTTGHTHAGTDGSGTKIPVASIDTTGYGAGAFLTADGSGGMDNASRIGAHNTAAAMGTLDATYRDAESTTIYCPRTTTTVLVTFSCKVTVTQVDTGEKARLDLKCLCGATQAEEVTDWYQLAMSSASHDEDSYNVYQFIYTPGTAATHTFTIQLKTNHTGTIASCAASRRTLTLQAIG